ncbi:hypothetical protein [Luteolibacter sp. LG18]|uniref:hypothetical protein n=1 Tax=Luteolibacter sp. LG18 TaxID=2819286 RepID=UPI002B3262F3|nr:hypothetical protein llg_07790 [Luteolibacter sp. LG18]
MKKIFGSLLALVGLSAFANATVTLTISGVGTGALTSLADSSSSTANGLVWGIVVDASGNGFDTANYQGGWTLNTTAGGILMPGSGDDVLYIATSNNLTATSLGTGGGVGSAISIAGLTLNGGLGVQGSGSTLGTVAGDSFAIIWFDRTTLLGGTVAGGSKFGIVTDPGLKLPGDGSNVGYNPLFTSVDPVRPTNLTFVPEPSAALLGAFGALALLRRRR